MLMWVVLAYLLGFGSIALAGVSIYPNLASRLRLIMSRRVEEASVQLEDMFMAISRQRLQLLYVIAPLVLGGLLWMTTGHWAAGAVGAVVGLLVPRFVLRMTQRRRAQQFHNQLVDSLLLMSSCLRAGLSMTQSFAVVAEEMPAPISQEFGLVLKEVRMGVNLDEAMDHLMKRMPSDELHMFISTVLVARETGGDVTLVFTRLVVTLRERKKIKEKIKTLTFMAKLQGIIMALLPVAFFLVTVSVNKSHFTFFVNDPDGRMLLLAVIVMQAMSTALFMRFSRSPI